MFGVTTSWNPLFLYSLYTIKYSTEQQKRSVNIHKYSSGWLTIINGVHEVDQPIHYMVYRTMTSIKCNLAYANRPLQTGPRHTLVLSAIVIFLNDDIGPVVTE